MKMRTDTIGHFKRATEDDIRSAISYPDENSSVNDLVKLMINDTNFICVWIGNRETGHTLELRFSSTKITSKEKINSESAIQVMIKYLHGDFEWLSDYTWGKSTSQQLIENMMYIAQMNTKST